MKHRTYPAESGGESTQERAGTLYIVSTPIGNLEDITVRGLRILREVDLIAAEDTRRSGMLLQHFGIQKPLTSFFQGNEQKKKDFVLSRLEEGKNVALVSDGGTPGISDPGYPLIRAAIEKGIPVIAIPGPCAAIVSLSVSGLPTDAFRFRGFLPRKSTKRREVLREWIEACETLVFYESPHRIGETLQDILDILGDRQMALGRELTKVHEEVLRGRVSDLLNELAKRKLKGEMTLVISGKGRRRERGTQ
jgi:16S rRNA (cytidine1402-2'-O)-methyltransferase